MKAEGAGVVRIPPSGDFGPFIDALSRAEEWIVLCHVRPDGDTLGSASALFSVGRKLGKSVVWGGPDSFPGRYSFLPGALEYRPNLRLLELPLNEKSVVVAVDTSTKARSVEDIDALPVFVPLLSVDHHHDNELFGTQNFLDPFASSTGEIIWLLLKEWGISLDVGILEALYTAITTDSGNFRFSCTTERTHRAAADLLAGGVDPAKMDGLIRCNATLPSLRLRSTSLSRIFLVRNFAAFTWLRPDDFLRAGCDRSDTDFLVNDLLLLKGVSFAAFFVEDEECVNLSLRSRGVLEAVEIAGVYGGGGHRQAAGCKLPLPLYEAMERVRVHVEEEYAKRLAFVE